MVGVPERQYGVAPDGGYVPKLNGDLYVELSANANDAQTNKEINNANFFNIFPPVPGS